MQSTDQLIEIGERLVERETAAGVARIRARLARPSRLVCDCGDQIPEARRKALPGVQDCFNCASRAEKHRRRA